MYKNKDGSNKLYRKSETCCSGTNCPFWKLPWKVKSGVRTRLQEKKSLEEYNCYFREKWIEEKWQCDQIGTIIIKTFAK